MWRRPSPRTKVRVPFRTPGHDDCQDGNRPFPAHPQAPIPLPSTLPENLPPVPPSAHRLRYTACMRDVPLILVGFMGCGKSTVGRLLAQRLDWPFVDLDDQIEAAA